MIIFLLKAVGIIIILCFEYVWMVEGIDMLVRLIKYFTVAKYNQYSTKIQKKIEERQVIPYKENQMSAGQMVDISSLAEAVPKLVVNIDIMTGKIQKKNVWKKRGILEKFLHPWNQGMKETIQVKAKTDRVKKDFIYVESLINTLNLNYPNWQKFNPELINVLKDNKIIAKEVIIPYLSHFQK